MKDNPNVRNQEKRSGKDQSSAPSLEAPKKNHFYALRSRGEQEDSSDVVTAMLQVFSINVNALLDPISRFSFLTLLYLKSLMFYPTF